MPKKLSCIAVAALASGLWFSVPGTQSIQAQTITFGPNGVQVGSNSPPTAALMCARLTDQIIAAMTRGTMAIDTAPIGATESTSNTITTIAGAKSAVE